MIVGRGKSDDVAIVNQTGQCPLQGLVATRFFRFAFWLQPSRDRSFRRPVDMYPIVYVAVFVPRAVVAGQCESRAVQGDVDDPAGEVRLIQQTLALIDLESRFLSPLTYGLERSLLVNRCYGRLFRPS